MPIRPIDMQVAIPKMSEISKLSHLEQQKAGLQQDQSAVKTDKNNLQEQQTVSSTQTDNQSNNDQDAKEEGKNTYYNRKGEIKGKKEDEKEVKRDASHQKIDIRI